MRWRARTGGRPSTRRRRLCTKFYTKQQHHKRVLLLEDARQRQLADVRHGRLEGRDVVARLAQALVRVAQRRSGPSGGISNRGCPPGRPHTRRWAGSRRRRAPPRLYAPPRRRPGPLEPPPTRRRAGRTAACRTRPWPIDTPPPPTLRATRCTPTPPASSGAPRRSSPCNAVSSSSRSLLNDSSNTARKGHETPQPPPGAAPPPSLINPAPRDPCVRPSHYHTLEERAAALDERRLQTIESPSPSHSTNHDLPCRGTPRRSWTRRHPKTASPRSGAPRPAPPFLGGRPGSVPAARATRGARARPENLPGPRGAGPRCYGAGPSIVMRGTFSGNSRARGTAPGSRKRCRKSRLVGERPIEVLIYIPGREPF